MTTFVLNGITYEITDYDLGAGLSTQQIQGIISNISTQGEYDRLIKSMAASGDAEDRTIRIDIDDPAFSRTTTWTGSTPGNVTNSELTLKLVSSQFLDGASGGIYKVVGTESGGYPGDPAQATVDQAIVHEVAHMYDYRINGTNIVDQSLLTQVEAFATAHENHFVTGLGLPARDRFASIQELQAFEAYHTSNGTTVYDPDPNTPAGSENILPQNVYDHSRAGSSPAGADSTAIDVDTFGDEVNDAENTSRENPSPLVLDIDGDGVELVNIASADAVYWDYDGDGFSEAGGWVAPDDGLLAIDVNDDGIINDSTELFGDQTGYANGFLALAAYDSNGDGKISDQDSSWGDFRVWIDEDGDAFSTEGELYTLDEKLISEINLGYSDSGSTIAGNDIKQESSFIINGNTRDIVDVYFSINNMNTIYNQSYIRDPAAYTLPTQRGYGEIPDLHISISLDNNASDPDSLISLAGDLADTNFADLFDETSALRDDIVDIMYRWAGVDDVDPTSRGPNIDARQLEFLEMFTGEDFVQTGSANQTDPGMLAAVDLEEAFTIAFNNIYARLATQAAGGDLFTGDFYYDIASDSFSGITGLDSTSLSSLQTEATGLSNTGEREIFWSNVLRVIEFAVGVDNLSGGDQTALGNAIYNSDNTLVMNDLIDGLDYQPTPGSALDGDGSNNTITGGSGNDEIDGAAGDDILSGAAGNDQITGGADDDTITGGTGSDYLIGGTGEDTYNYAPGDGYDVVKEQSTGTGNTNDRIVFGSGIDSGDLTFERAGNTGLRISIDNGVDDPGEIVIENQFNYAAGGGHVEWIDFYADTSIEIATQNFTLTGTAGADTLYGSRYGSAGADTIYGGDGNDTVYGYAPNETSDTEVNTLYGGNGNDKLYAGDGGDTVYGEAGNDTLTGGSGADTLSGGSGDDTYTGNAGNDVFVYTSGNDTITDTSGTNEIQLVAAWDSETPQYFRIGNDLEIFWDASNSITVVNHFTTGEMNQMVYDDTGTVALTSVSAVTQGTSGNDNLTGTTGPRDFAPAQSRILIKPALAQSRILIESRVSSAQGHPRRITAHAQTALLQPANNNYKLQISTAA